MASSRAAADLASVRDALSVWTWVFFLRDGPEERVDVSQGFDSGAGCDRADLNGWAAVVARVVAASEGAVVSFWIPVATAPAG
jgi:hypothetical protein